MSSYIPNHDYDTVKQLTSNKSFLCAASMSAGESLAGSAYSVFNAMLILPVKTNGCHEKYE